MQVTSTGGVSATSGQAVSRTPPPVDNGLGRDAFLRLLVAQLKYQNPMEPMKDQEFVAQLAQFSALQELTQVREATLFGQGLSLLGRDVRVVTFGGEELAGEVRGISQGPGGTSLMIDGQQIALTDLEEVELT